MGKLLTPLALSWSGGKDSSFVLWKLQQSGIFSVKLLQTTLSESYNRISMHGVRRELLVAQAESIDIALQEIYLPESATMEAYNERMQMAADALKAMEIEDVAFGDLFLADLKAYRTNQLAKVGMNAHFPIWGIPTEQLAHDFIAAGFQSIVVCTDNSKLNPSFCGRLFDESFLKDLPAEVDPCGENGEFHTFCFGGPIFKKPVSFEKGALTERVYEYEGRKMGFTFCELNR